MIGPFIFFDHLGPATFAAGHGIDVRPHPHIGLATGRGIAHSERTPRARRAAEHGIHGIQSWVALPDGAEDVDPAFAHHPAASLPQIRRALLTLIAGEGFGLKSPVASPWPTLYVDAELPPGSTFELPLEHAERAIYVVAGAVDIGNTRLSVGQMGILEPVTIRLQAVGPARVMLLGGARFPTPRQLYWNFVASSSARIDEAKSRWKNRQFPAVPGESEFIPLPL